MHITLTLRISLVFYLEGKILCLCLYTIVGRTDYINALVFEPVYKTKIRLTSLSEINKLNSFVIVIYKIEARRTVLVI